MKQLGQFTFENKERAKTLSMESPPVFGVARSTGLTPNAKYQSKDVSKYKIIRPGMFAYNPMHLNIGSIAYSPHTQPVGLVSPDYVVFSCDPSKLAPPYMKYVIEGPAWKQWTTNAGVGSVRVRIYYKELAEMPFDPPPLPEQKAIAHILGTLDDKIELNRRMNATLEGMAQALFKSWFVDFDPVIDNALAAGNPIPDELAPRAEVRRQALANGTANREAAKPFPAAFQEVGFIGWIPEGWEVGQISELLELHRGFDLSASKRMNGSFPVYSAGGIHGTHNEYKMDPPGIITGRSGAIGNVYLSLTQYWPLNTTLYVREFRKCGPFYALHFLRNMDLKIYNSGSAVPSLNRNYVHSSDTIIPSKKSLKAFELFLAGLYKKIKANDEESKKLTQLRDTLLPKLISGKLSVPATSR